MKKYLSAFIEEKMVYLELDSIQEVVDSFQCRSVPKQKEGALGITNYRGNLIPVFDIHGSTLKNILIILTHEKQIVGLAVNKVRSIDLINLTGSPKHTDNPFLEQFENGFLVSAEKLVGRTL